MTADHEEASWAKQVKKGMSIARDVHLDGPLLRRLWPGPIFRPKVVEHGEISIGREDGELHLSGKSSDHDVNLRKNSARPAQFRVDLAIEPGRLQIDRPQAQLGQKVTQVLAILRLVANLLEAGFDLAP
jgi:hypothetical protein